MRPPRFGFAHTQPTSQTIARRQFVAWMGGVLVLSACERSPEALLGPRLAGAKPTPPPPTNRSVLLNARDLGARGDGATDDTTALNAAITSLGPAGGTLWLPAGIYLVDPSKSVRMANNVTLLLDADATLRAIPVSAGSSSIIIASGAANVAITGGNIVGERNGHLGTTGEWGMGIRIVGSSNVTIKDVRISDCWGDGIYVGAFCPGKESRKVSIAGCVVTGNRRQGLSVTGCIGAKIEDCEFTDTHGTLPESGIDLEPNETLQVSDITIKNCVMARNAGYGILMCGATVSDIHVENSSSADNALAGAALIRGTNSCEVTGSQFERNLQQGLLLDAASYNHIEKCTFRGNSAGQPSVFPNVLLSGGSTQNTISDNQFDSLRRLIQPSRSDVIVTPDCHDNSIDIAAGASSPIGVRGP